MQEHVNAYLQTLVPAEPRSLYDPVRYIINGGGKRLRPALTYFCSLSNEHSDWVSAACAVELLHTFTLVHDDIMDNAFSRRGHATVHEQFDLNTAILSGDVLIALAETSLAAGKYSFHSKMMSEFADGFRYVCEGQALDKEFEMRTDITIDDYFWMIDLKSAKMIELAAVLGAFAAGLGNIESLRRFAHHLGLAFQLRDDLLDLTGSDDFGKTIGGDIIEGKRTFLFLKALEAYPTLSLDKKKLLDRVSTRNASPKDIPNIRLLFEELGVITATTDMIELHTANAADALASVEHEAVRNALLLFSNYLLHRNT